VHQRSCYGRVVDNRGEWDLTPGSYDHWLAARHATAGAAKAAGSTRQGRPAGADGPDADGVAVSAALAVRGYDASGPGRNRRRRGPGCHRGDHDPARHPAAAGGAYRHV
jgi:hypothetical protein